MFDAFIGVDAPLLTDDDALDSLVLPDEELLLDELLLDELLSLLNLLLFGDGLFDCCRRGEVVSSRTLLCWS